MATWLMAVPTRSSISVAAPEAVPHVRPFVFGAQRSVGCARFAEQAEEVLLQ